MNTEFQERQLSKNEISCKKKKQQQQQNKTTLSAVD